MPLILQLGPLYTDPTYQPRKLSAEFVMLQGSLAQNPTIQARTAEVVAIITNSSRGASAADMALFPNLKLVANSGIGLDRVDVATAAARGIVVTNTPDLVTDDVADLAICLAIDCLRGVHAADRFLRAGQWGKQHAPLGRAVRGKHLGIFGFGRIGQAIAARALPFGFAPGYCNRSPRDTSLPRFETIEALAAWSDVLVLAAPGSPSTEKIVTETVLHALGPNGFLINIARGTLVDDAALIAALQNNTIAGAALDVFTREPAIPPALLDLPNVLLSPHNGTGTRETRALMADQVYAEVANLLAGQPPIHPFTSGV